MSYYWKVKSITPCDHETLGNVIRHNTRKIERELDGHGSIYPDRSHLNEHTGPQTPGEAVTMVEGLIAGAGVHKRRKNSAIAIEAVFSLPPDTVVNIREYFHRCHDWFIKSYQCPVISTTIHLDEDAPHMHVIACPLKDGKLQARNINGDKRQLATRHRDFMATVALPMGLPNLQPKLIGPLKANAIEQIITSIKAANDPAIHSNWWEAIEKSIRFDPRPFMVRHTQHETAIAVLPTSWKCDEDGVIFEADFKPLSCVALLNPPTSTTQTTRLNPPVDHGIYRRYTPAQYVGTFTGLMN